MSVNHTASFLAALLSALISASSAAAADYVREFGGWTAARSGMSCAIWQIYEGSGSTKLSLLHTLENETPTIFVNNTYWSAIERARYEISYSFSKNKYTIGSVGVAIDGQKGFAGKTHPDFLSDFAVSQSVTITMGDKVIDQLSLAGSGAAVAELRRCMSLVNADHIRKVREEGRQNRLPPGVPRDPFSGQQCEQPLPEKRAVEGGGSSDRAVTQNAPDAAPKNADVEPLRSASSMPADSPGGDREFQKLFGNWSSAERNNSSAAVPCKIAP